MKTELTPNETVDSSFDDELKPGTSLLHGQYVIEEFLNNGGFGITYLARDSLDRLVVIKECFPESICSRNNGTVRVRSRSQAEAFRTIVELFIEEARSLARLSHPNIVGVHQVFEDNDTAYMAMDYVQGRDLLEIADSETSFNPAALEQITLKLLDAVEFIHDVGVLHRDIAPDNILLSSSNEPVLIDFGAARENVSLATSYLGSMRTVKDGYSPQEFYANNSEQHPSSDLYSLAASLYHVITKKLPASAQARLSAIASGEDDPYVPVGEFATGYSEPFFESIDHALSVFPKDRIQTAAEWRSMITQSSEPRATRGSISRPTLAVDNGNVIPTENDVADTSLRTDPSPRQSRKVRPGAKSVQQKIESVFLEDASEQGKAQKKAVSGKGIYLGGVAVAALVLVGGATVFLSGDNEQVAGISGAGVTEKITSASPDESDAAPVAAPNRTVEQMPFFLTESENSSALPAVEPPIRSTGSGAVTSDLSPRSTSTDLDIAANQESSGTTTTTAEAPIENGGLASADVSAEMSEEIMTGAIVQLEVTPDPFDPTLIVDVGGSAADELRPGLRVVSINGFPVEALSDLQRVVQATSDLQAGENVSVTFGLQDPSNGSTFVRSVELPVSKQTMLLSGVSFETVRENETWVTYVTAGSGAEQSDLQSGDKLIALMPDNEMIDGEDTLADLISREIRDGSNRFNFAVNRGGSMWLVSMNYGANAGE
ncbi:MAG: protein kinase [Pseudomonadota bacterium]